MFTQFAEGLWSRITEHVSDIKYSLKQTVLGLESFNKTFWIRMLFVTYSLRNCFSKKNHFIRRKSPIIENHNARCIGVTFVCNLLE